MLATQTAPLQEAVSTRFTGPDGLFDEHGFLVDSAHWNEALAERIARREAVGALDERHWKLLHHIRDRYQALGAMPGMRRVCRATGLSRGEVYALFGGCLPLWRIAGLPNPGEEARAYLS